METQSNGTAGQETPGYLAPGHGPTGNLVYKKDAALYLGVSLKTLERYVKQGLIKPFKNEVNGRTYFDQLALLALLGSRLPQEREVVLYCRAAGIPDQGRAGVSSGSRLREQVDRCTEYCTKAGIRVDRIIQEIGKGHTLAGRGGVDQLLDLVFRKKVSMIVVECPDRLARWGMGEILERFLAWHGVELHVINKGWSRAEFREEVKEDLAGILYEAKRLLGEA